MYNPFSLEDKVILVTGASSGIGRGIAIDTSKMGAKVYITARNENRLNETFSQMNGKSNVVIPAELTNENEIDELVEKLPLLDGIVLCAGIIKTMPVKNITDVAIEEIFKVNIISGIQLLSRLLRKKKLNKEASVVIISSVSTFNVKVGNSLYSATKGAINSFAKAMALEVSKQKMRVNCIQPGFVPSSILDQSGIEQDSFLRWYAERHPLGFGKPSDIANACIYLLSDAAKWVTGSIFTIDGGYTLQ
ncbi:MAG TPA: SDR family oxidoreductase [Candidatus Butyricimonas faecavium]|nr:SDR family oxidoreductase [Candidatus Butyricimonas faecavium]